MAVMKQFSVRLPNKPGQLAKLCKCLKDAKVNILAISVLDSTDSGIVRFVPDRPDITDDLLCGNRYCYDVKGVVMITLENVPGALYRVARKLSTQKINIDYLYTANHPDVERTVLVLSVPQPRKVTRILRA